MLRHEDRLYHIVISFPSICARQFFIFKCKYLILKEINLIFSSNNFQNFEFFFHNFFVILVRRNEAIFCLIGFGIGIGCCLVYKWFQAKLLTFNQLSMNYLEKNMDIKKNDHKDLYSENNKNKYF